MTHRIQSNGMLVIARVALVVVCAFASAGCKTEPMDARFYEGGPPEQKYEFSEVKRRVKNLRPGMVPMEVLVVLGSPAERDGDTWVYLPGRPGFLVPAELLRVRFENGRYASHVFSPILLGEKVKLR